MVKWHPKRKISKTRRDKEKNTLQETAAAAITCPITGEAHLYHTYRHEGKMYYRGQVVIDKSVVEI
jgi:large subunit ribosomal protein L32